ncbi:C6 zinc finger domain protein [Coniochaeta sp. 2T2.1]|nr:C6 zinc finger domain protein [Coniochaeta sp. 2T2.1]
MVGVPRSTGCQLCVKRRVKCDQDRPSCGNCNKYGEPCPGYDRQMKFVAGKHRVRSRRQGDWASETTAGPADPKLPSEGSVHGDGSEGTSSEITFSASLEEPLFLYLSPSDDRGHTINGIIQSLNATQASAEVRIFAPWFKDVPERLGHKVTLDSAMAAFTLHLLGKAKQDDVLIGESRTIYGQALVALQRALNHPAEWKSSETLCATMILSFFELFAGTKDAASWMKHAAGVSWLLQQRGPEAHRDDWDRSMLVSFRNIIIMHALFSGQDCFLARRAWQKLLADEPVIDNRGDGTLTELYAITNRYGVYLARLPAILHRGYALREARRHGLPIEPSHVTLLVRRAEKLRSEMAALFEGYTALAPAPTEVPSREPGSIYDTVLSYANVWHGSFRMSCWASLLILQAVLDQCRWPVERYAVANRELARSIYRSLECVGTDLLGPLRVGYPLRIAYEFADLRTQLWISSLLAKFEKRYASTAPNGYPTPGSNDLWGSDSRHTGGT